MPVKPKTSPETDRKAAIFVAAAEAMDKPLRHPVAFAESLNVPTAAGISRQRLWQLLKAEKHTNKRSKK